MFMVLSGPPTETQMKMSLTFRTSEQPSPS